MLKNMNLLGKIKALSKNNCKLWNIVNGIRVNALIKIHKKRSTYLHGRPTIKKIW